MIHKQLLRLCIAAFVVASASFIQAQLPPLIVEPMVNPPYTASYVQYFQNPNQITVTVLNNMPDAVAHQIYFAGSISTFDGTISARIDGGQQSSADPITIGIGTTMLNGTDLTPFVANSAGQVHYDNITEEDIRLGLLPEGEYQLCLQAFDYLTNEPLSASAPSSGCSNSFTITYPPPPQLLNPECGATVDGIQPQTVLFNWILPSGPPIGALMQYHFKLVLLPEGDVIDPLSALQTSNDPVWEDDVMTPLVLYTQLMPALLNGRRYAWYVRAVDMNGQHVFQNNGWSEPCTFVWSGTGAFTLAYPMVNDTLPWDFLPIVARFDPYRGDITQFNSELTLTHVGGEQETYERHVVWASGPQLSQQYVLGIPVSEDQARHINIYKRPGEAGVMYFESEEEHVLSADIMLSPNSGTPILGHIDGGFASGMGVPRMISPANEAELERNGGDPEVIGYAPVPLRFKTAEQPSRLLPPYPIIQNVDGESSQTDGRIYQRWRLDVSKTVDFAITDTTTSARVGQLLSLLDATCNEACAIAELYKEVEFNFNPSADGTYYWRVVWLTEPNSEFGPHYRASPTYRFTIGEGTEEVTGEGSTTAQEEIPPAQCLAESRRAPTAILERDAANTIYVGDSVEVGLFKMRINSISFGANNLASGEGLIHVPVMHALLRVRFNQVKINSNKRLFSGEVNAIYDNEGVIPSSWIQGTSLAAGFSPQAADSIDQYLNIAGRLTSQMIGSTPMGLPIGVDKEVFGIGRVVIGILGMQFTDTIARMNAGMALPAAELGTTLSLGNMAMPFHPGGFGDLSQEATLYLLSDLSIGMGEDTLRFKGAQFAGGFESVQDSGTFVAWDCQGFRALQIDAEWRFSKDHLMEDKPDGTSGPDKIVASLKTRTGRGGFMGRVDFNKPFHIEGAEGWGFDVQEAWMDLASYANPPAMNLPPSVAQRVGTLSATNDTLNTWQGFYLKRAMLRFPHEVKRFGSTERVTVLVDDMVIAQSKLTASFKLANLIGESEGELDGWAFSLDTLQFDIVANSFSQAGIKGRIRTAISPTLLDYSAMLRQSPTNHKKWLEFLLQPENDLSVPFLAGTMTLAETSTIRAALGDPELGTYAKATLNGKLSIDQQLGAIPINFRDIAFEDLSFQTRSPYTNMDSEGVFSLASPQKYMGATEVPDDTDPVPPTSGGSTGGFPISLTRVKGITTTIGDKPAAGIAFDINVQLTSDSNIFKATTRIEVLGTLNTSEIHQWGDNKVQLDSIGVTGGIGTVEISGGLKWYRDSPTYGNGIKGGLRAKFMKGQVEILATAQFGKLGDYSYWYVDAMAAREGGFNKPSPFTIYGFGGGAWYHMQAPVTMPPAESITQQELTHLNEPDFEPGVTSSGVSYTPNKNIDLGFMATIVFGDPSSGYAYNGNISALAQFAGGGLQSIGLKTDLYMLHKKELDGVIEGDVPIKGHGDILFVFATDVFTANFNMFVDVKPGQLVGIGKNNLAGTLDVLITPDTWHFYVGRPDSRVGLKIAGLLNVESYFMVGDDLPGIPLPPPEIASLVPPGYLVREDISDASGLAFGASVSVKESGDFLVFRYKVDGTVGFDLLFLRSSEMACAGIEDPGIGPFYARGQVYGGINASVSIYVDMWIGTVEKELFTVGVAGMFECGFANPSWLKGFAHGNYDILGGSIKGEATIPFQAGTKCQPPQNNILDEINPLGDLSPANYSGLPPSCSDYLVCGVDCGVEPKAVFNIEVDHPFTFNEATTHPRTLRVVIEKFVLKDEADKEVKTKPHLSSDHTQISLHPDDYLTPEKQYTLYIKLRADELKDNKWGPAKKGSASITWERTHTFKTDGGIEELSAENLDYTYPFDRQRFVLQNECRQGVIMCNAGMAGQPVFKSPVRKHRTFKVVIMSMLGGTPMSQSVIPMHDGNSSVPFILPQLENGLIYNLKLVARDTPVMEMSANGPTTPQAGQQQSAQEQMANVNMSNTSMGVVSEAPITSNQGMVNRMDRTIKGYELRPDEKLIYEYYFRTSHYNMLPEKVAALVNTSTSYTTNTQAPPKETLTPSFSGEGFDVYDLVGFEYGPENGELQMMPLIGVKDANTDVWHQQFAKPLLYDYYAAIKASNCSELQLARTSTSENSGFPSFRITTTISDYPDPIGIPPYNTVRFHPGGPAPSPLLSTAETAPSNNFQINHGVFNTSQIAADAVPTPDVKLQFRTADWVRDDYVRLQTITPVVIAHCGPLNANYNNGDDVFPQMSEPLRSYVTAFLDTPYKLMYNGAYKAKFSYYPPPPCAPFLDSGEVGNYSNGMATFQHTSGATPPRPHVPGSGTDLPTNPPIIRH